MQRMRDVIRGSLARSLRCFAEEDRLAAALPVVCGTALASHCDIARLEDGGVVHIAVDASEWLHTLLGMRAQLLHDLQLVAGLSLSALHFEVAAPATQRVSTGKHSELPVRGSIE